MTLKNKSNKLKYHSIKSKTQKLKKKRNTTLLKKGGALMYDLEKDLKNTHLLPRKDGKYKESPALELFTSISDVFELNKDTLGYVKSTLCKSKNAWFKFVIFKNNEQLHVFLIRGARINKHSVCLLLGLLEVSENDYIEMRTVVDTVKEMKDNGITGIDDNHPQLSTLNKLIQRDIPFMPVIVAGSGTYDDDNQRICINTKSGHYKPDMEKMEFAQKIFEKMTNENVFIQTKVDKKLLKAKYGDNYEEYSGICL